MEFDCTKDGKNIYFACREKAAKYNDLLNSRERAAELLGISTSTLEMVALLPARAFPKMISCRYLWKRCEMYL